MDSDTEIWICHNNEDDFCSKTEQILSRMVNYLPYIEGLSLHTSVPFSRGRKTSADWPRLNPFDIDDRWQITSSPTKTDSKYGPEGVRLKESSLFIKVLY